MNWSQRRPHGHRLGRQHHNARFPAHGASGVKLWRSRVRLDSSTVICLIVFGGVVSAVFVFVRRRWLDIPSYRSKLSPASRTLLFSSSHSLMVLRSSSSNTTCRFSYSQPKWHQQPPLAFYYSLALTTCLSGFCAGLYIDKTGRFHYVGQEYFHGPGVCWWSSNLPERDAGASRLDCNDGHAIHS